ncbi:hypothetical protein ASPZODRAFT_61579 [Penicilliopsis zonata CBS 506.65]|uniref:alcohol dehydrogenase n=1 Tax=Penicilliopsis zonata CBS 506.65 TaxID=1073090 RepID=A0A1L9SMC8_9EURO|nr:hypothetical protein ASPZODRAFT_61579 [Penicilliopsis zonata CBS 506.65]OJJ48338.1 hypothetical protein ASPZODRAFT_61579 [Penicilliopsis zonata CBS 506.65]
MGVPETQWAQVIEQVGGPAVYKQIPVPRPGPDEVLVKIKYSSVCHTDLHVMRGELPMKMKMPLIGGHEGTGMVVARGELANQVKIGDHVGIKWLHDSCRACEFCQKAEEVLCPHAQMSGYTVDGTFQQYCTAKAAYVSRIPKDVPLDAVAPILCAGISVYRALKESGAQAGQSVAIVGAGGGLGALALQYAKAMSLRVIAIDEEREKQQMCMNLGAEVYVDFTQSDDIVKDVRAASPDGLGPHAAIIVAMSEKPFQQAPMYVRSHGTVVAVGLPPNAFIKAPIVETVTRMISIKGSYKGNRQDSVEAIDFFVRGLIHIPFKTATLKDLNNVFDLMDKQTIVGRYVLQMPD